MSVLIFVLSLVLLAGGLLSGYMSLDLIPTSPGLIYAFAGAVSVVGAIVVFALGVLVFRVGRMTRALREQAAAAAAFAAVAAAPAQEPAEPPALAEADAAETLEAEPLEAEPGPEIEPEHEGTGASTSVEASPAGEAEGEPEEAEEPINENRAGHLPTLAEIEHAIETPEAPPTLIGRYASGGANYMIFSDGSIEAETDEGAFKFASMGDFKQFLLDRNAGKG
jgi:hypothetical protein